MSIGKQGLMTKLKYDYEDEIKTDILTNISRIAFPILLPLYILANIIDWIIVPSHGIEFLILRLLTVPIAALLYYDLKSGWSRSWYPFHIWFFSFFLSLQLVYMALQGKSSLSLIYLFMTNFIAGLVIFFFTMRFRQNMLILLAFYCPQAVALYWMNSSDSFAVLVTLISAGMFIAYCVAAKSMDVLRYRTYQQKTNLFFLATTDALSGLKLRRYFFNRFLQELSLRFRRAAEFKVSVALIDIDNFKQINDQYGHKTGDELIKHISDIIRNSIRVYDTACRFGGEEFIILLPDTRLEEARIVSERIREAIVSLPLLSSSNEVRATVSTGVSGMELEIPESFSTIHSNKEYKYILLQQMLEIIKRADDCLYQAKHQGKNCVVVGSRVDLLQAIDEETVESLKGYLVYFDQDVFSLPSEDVDTTYSMTSEEVNFYTEEYFFRRAVESMYRSYRDPEWQEMLVVMEFDCPNQTAVQKELCKMFRVADTICRFNMGRYGLIFYDVKPGDLENITERIHLNLMKIMTHSQLKIRAAASTLRFAAHRPLYQKARTLSYHDFADQVSAMLGVLKRHRFTADKPIYFYT